MSLRRRTPLRRGNPLATRTPLRRTRWRPRRHIAAAERAFREHVLAAHPFCQVRGPRCTGRSEHAHHILPRSQGGDHHPDNGLGCCGADHLYVHANPALSYERGWLRRRP